jgi:hypothetical protein
MRYGDMISRRGAIEAINELHDKPNAWLDLAVDALENLPSAQPQYEELTPEEAASEIASGSTMSAWYWLDDMTRLKQMGYVVCRKR